MMKDKLRYHFLPNDTFVYSGLFITLKEDLGKNSKAKLSKLKHIFDSKEFIKHIKLTGPDRSGGYK